MSLYLYVGTVRLIGRFRLWRKAHLTHLATYFHSTLLSIPCILSSYLSDCIHQYAPYTWQV